MIIYLTNPQGGSTIIEGKEYMANEDDVLIFDGKLHCARPPRKDVRIVLVITFLLWQFGKTTLAPIGQCYPVRLRTYGHHGKQKELP